MPTTTPAPPVSLRGSSVSRTTDRFLIVFFCGLVGVFALCVIALAVIAVRAAT